MYEYAVTRQWVLKVHKESKHEGIRYPCDLCKYVATEQTNFKRHKKSKHEETRFFCDKCEFATTRLHNLKITRILNMMGTDIPVTNVNIHQQQYLN